MRTLDLGLCRLAEWSVSIPFGGSTWTPSSYSRRFLSLLALRTMAKSTHVDSWNIGARVDLRMQLIIKSLDDVKADCGESHKKVLRELGNWDATAQLREGGIYTSKDEESIDGGAYKPGTNVRKEMLLSRGT